MTPAIQGWVSRGIPEAAALKLAQEARRMKGLPRSKRVAAMRRLYRMALRARGWA